MQNQDVRAAGVLPIRISNNGHIEALLPLEYRFEKDRNIKIHILGGQKGKKEVPLQTAVRECYEEINQLVPKQKLHALMSKSSKHVYIPRGKYNLYILFDKDGDFDDIPKRYEDHFYSRTFEAEPESIHWLPWSHMKRHRNITIENDVFECSQFLSTIIEHEDVNQEIIDIVSSHLQCDLELEIKSMQSLEDKNTFLPKLFGHGWQLSLKSPPLPPRSGIQCILKSDPEYQAILKLLPSSIQSSVLTIRKVNVTSKVSNYNKQKAMKQVYKEIVPLFHGTGETWRAWAIAMHGFDLSIRLNGRARGDGVYGSTDFNVAYGYGQSGSVLHMKGLVAQEGGDSIYVFPDPKDVLPTYILDFAPINNPKSSSDVQVEDEKERLKKIMEDIEKKQEQFLESAYQRYMKSKDYYKSKLDEWASVSSHLQDIENIEIFSRRFAIERQQSYSNLPIYSYKHELVQALKNHDVIVILAETGSGKSTQVPQYLCDEVFPFETRRIAVLQPRRVNAISLATRVAHERFDYVGDEVGYHIGLGDTKQSSKTKIEFMTHGLFVHMSQNPETLLSRYCAVILDESHERSIPIDLSLSFLRRALESRRKDDPPFKVIIMSATIQAHSDQFLSFMDVNECKSTKLEIPGSSFPVHIEYRNDGTLDKNEIGPDGVGKVLSSYAMQTALDLLKVTYQGNILVFMPGESHIQRAIEHVQTTLKEAYKIKPSRDQRSFTFKIKEERKKILIVGVYPFHGRLTPTQRNNVLYPKEDRIVVFTTNIAETGLTIPNVRYVIDTGMERRVQFNPETLMNEMTTTPITRSSMVQRSGRAGRVASGICVRLYSESLVDEMIPHPPPTIQNGDILATVLRLIPIRDDIHFIDEIPQETKDLAMKMLQHLGAVDDTQQITKLGTNLLDIGVDLRLGRFLLACHVAGCMNSGVTLASLMIVDAKVLPHRKMKLDKTFLTYLDPSGDHITLLNIFNAFKDEIDPKDWCYNNEFDYEEFLEANVVYEHLLKTLIKIQIPLADDEAIMERNGGRNRSILRALCSGYFDHIAISSRPGFPQDGFVALKDPEQHLKITQEDPTIRTDPLQESSPLESDSSNQLRLSGVSSLWHLTDLEGSKTMAVYDSIMKTDNGIPSLKMVSYIDVEDIREGAPDWCKSSNFNRMYEHTVRSVEHLPITKQQEACLLEGKGKYMEQLRRKVKSYGNVKMSIRKHHLVISAQKRVIDLVKLIVKNYLNRITPDNLELKLPANVNPGTFIGKGGANKSRIEKDLNNILRNMTGNPNERVVLKVDSKKGTVTIQIGGKGKAFSSILIGRVQSEIYDTYQDYDLYQSPSNSLNNNPRLMCLSTKAPPSNLSSRDDAILYMAHAAIWSARCAVFGGFVRDWVINGEPANDIDVRLNDPNMTVVKVKSILISVASKQNIQLVQESQNGKALKLSFRWNSITVDVDITDPNSLVLTPPGVDSDVGNLMIVWPGIPKKKIESAGGNHLPLRKCISHTQKKKFVFFYSFDDPKTRDEAIRRAKKLLSKDNGSWRCISNIPKIPELKNFFSQIQPKAKYSLKWCEI